MSVAGEVLISYHCLPLYQEMKMPGDHSVKIETEGYSIESQWFIQAPGPWAIGSRSLAPIGFVQFGTLQVDKILYQESV